MSVICWGLFIIITTVSAGCTLYNDLSNTYGIKAKCVVTIHEYECNTCPYNDCIYYVKQATIQGITGSRSEYAPDAAIPNHSNNEWGNHLQYARQKAEGTTIMSLNIGSNPDISCNCITENKKMHGCNVEIKTCFRFNGVDDAYEGYESYESWISDASGHTGHYCCDYSRTLSLSLAWKKLTEENTACVTTTSQPPITTAQTQITTAQTHITTAQTQITTAQTTSFVALNYILNPMVLSAIVVIFIVVVIIQLSSVCNRKHQYAAVAPNDYYDDGDDTNKGNQFKYINVKPSAPSNDTADEKECKYNEFNVASENLWIYTIPSAPMEEEFEIKQELQSMNYDDNNMECVVCMDGICEYALTPCHHLCLCSNCKDLLNGKCPRCLQQYQSIIRIYV